MQDMRHEFALPDLGLGDTPILASTWLVGRGGKVVEGDPLLELAAGDVTVDLPAPLSGVLDDQLVEEDDEVVVGQVLGVIIADPR